jgi:glutamate--cysteine ligase
LHALRERGVEYVEVRLMDLDPFEPMGITAQTMRFLDIFLLHCLLTDSPPDTPQEIVALAHNQHNVAERGRDPALRLERGDATVPLKDWGLELVAELLPYARQLDATHGCTDYVATVESAVHALHHPDALPSARVLREVTENFDGCFVAFVRAQSLKTRQAMLDAELPAAVRDQYAHIAHHSLQDQARIEAGDSMPFDIYLQEYLSPRHLNPVKPV